MAPAASAVDPTPPAFAPVWLAVADVKEWLKINAQDTGDDALLTRTAAMAEAHVQRCRPEWFTADADGVETYTPDAETYSGGVMYAAREYRRRNSPAGIEVFGEATSFVTRYDPDIDRALQTGAYAPPIVS
jgi:hypothetical protein